MEQRNLDAEALALLYEGVEEVEVPAGFVVKDLQTADWAIGKAKYATLQIAEKRSYAEFCKKKIDGWLEGETKKHDATINTMSVFLEPWVRSKLEGQKERSIKLPAGRVGFRKTSGKIEMDDEAFVPTAEKLGIKVQTKKYVLKTDVKEYIQSTCKKDENGKVIPNTGKIPDGVTMIPGSDRFYLEVE